jgi:prepilin-type N-terminal cleavage/methylation domain-containing protein
MHKQTGFTLIEIAIVMVIIGLLLGGILKGQELFNSARIRNLISQQDGVKAAYFGFLDRFRTPPGDYGMATTHISGTTTNGNGNGQVQSVLVARSKTYRGVEHISRAGFINGAGYAAFLGPRVRADQCLRTLLHSVDLDNLWHRRWAMPQHQNWHRFPRKSWPKSTARSTTAIR